MNESEQLIAELLSQRGLRAERFPKADTRTGKQTPDFRVYRGETFEFFCEVKESTDADPLENHYVEREHGIKYAEQLKVNDRSRGNRMARNIAKSVEQFDDVNPNLEYANVLAIVNRDDLDFFENLREILVGYLELDDGSRVSTIPATAKKQIELVRHRIHLYIWLDMNPFDKPSHRYLFWNRHDAPTERLRELFADSPKI